MAIKARPLFYKPVFGNDNNMPMLDAVDVAAFVTPALRTRDVAIDVPPRTTEPSHAKA